MNEIDSIHPVDHTKTKVIILGVSEYRDKSFNIPNIKANIVQLIDLLKSEHIGINKENIYVLGSDNNVNFGNNEILKLLEEVADMSEPDDTIIYYYSGHGIQSYDRITKKLNTYFATYFTNNQNITTYGVDVDRFQDYIKLSPAKRKIIIVDCCHSGSIHAGKMSFADNSIMSKLNNLEGTFIISATSEDVSAIYPIESPQEPTYFTGKLIDLLRNGVHNNQKYITTGRLYQHIVQDLVKLKLPKPQKSSFSEGDKFPIAINLQFSNKAEDTTFDVDIMEDDNNSNSTLKALFALNETMKNSFDESVDDFNKYIDEYSYLNDQELFQMIEHWVQENTEVCDERIDSWENAINKEKDKDTLEDSDKMMLQLGVFGSEMFRAKKRVVEVVNKEIALFKKIPAIGVQKLVQNIKNSLEKKK